MTISIPPDLRGALPLVQRRVPYFSENQWPAVLRLWRVRVDSRIADSSVGMLYNAMSEESSASPADPIMAVVLCDVEQCRLAGEES